MTWQWVTLIATVLAFIAVLSYISAWKSNHDTAVRAVKQMQMEGPRPFWMQTPPKSLEEWAALLQQTAEGEDGRDEGA